MRHFTEAGFEEKQVIVSEAPDVSGDEPLSILKNYAKTLFNKCVQDDEPSLTPMEQAKFDAAQAMLRDGKTTRYAYYKYKSEFEKPILHSLRTVLSTHGDAETRSLNLSDEALRKVANFVDQQDQSKVQALREDPARYAEFINEAYMIAHVRTGRSKSRRIEETLEMALEDAQLETQEPEDQIDLNKADLHALIKANVGDELSADDIDSEIASLARNMQKPLAELGGIIKSMSPADRQEDGINDRCFFLFGKYIGINTSSAKPLKAIANMMSFMTACFAEHIPEMINDLQDAQASDGYHDFLHKHAPALIKTYQFLAPTGYLSKGAATVKEEDFVAFVADVDAEFEKNAYTADISAQADLVQNQRTVMASDAIPLRYTRGPSPRNLYTRFDWNRGPTRPAELSVLAPGA